MIRWLEANGYDVSYVAGVDTDRSGARCCSSTRCSCRSATTSTGPANQRANVEAARDAGVHLAFFSGNEIFWKTRWEPSIDGDARPTTARSSRTRRRTRTPRSTRRPQWTGTWRDPLGASLATDGGRPENALTRHDLHGQLLHVRDAGARRADGDLRFWRNTQRRDARRARSDARRRHARLRVGRRPRQRFASRRARSTCRRRRVNVPERITDQGSNYAPGTATHSLTLHRVGNALVFGGGHGAVVVGARRDPRPRRLDAEHRDAAGDGQPVRRHGRAARQRCRPASRPRPRRPTPPRRPSTITRPASATPSPPAPPVTITGTAADTGGGRVGGVEVSTDGGDVASRERPRRVELHVHAVGRRARCRSAAARPTTA